MTQRLRRNQPRPGREFQVERAACAKGLSQVGAWSVCGTRRTIGLVPWAVRVRAKARDAEGRSKTGQDLVHHRGVLPPSIRQAMKS